MNYLASPEFCRKLKELGVPQNTLYYYCGKRIMDYSEIVHDKITDFMSAFSTDELLAMMPSYIKIGRYEADLILQKDVDKYWVGYINTHEEIVTDTHSSNDVPANALAKCLIHLLENKIIDVKDLSVEVKP